MHALSGIRIRCVSNQAVADLRLRPHGQRIGCHGDWVLDLGKSNFRQSLFSRFIEFSLSRIVTVDTSTLTTQATLRSTGFTTCKHTQHISLLFQLTAFLARSAVCPFLYLHAKGPWVNT